MLPPDCKAILLKNPKATSGYFDIRPPNGKAMHVYCDMDTDNGGWTNVIEFTKFVIGVMPTIEIDDMHLDYKEVLWVSCLSHFLNYEYKESEDFANQGYNFIINFLQFGNKMYRLRPPKKIWKVPKGTVWVKKNAFKTLDPPPKQCNFDGQPSNICANRFIFQKPIGKHLTGFGDIESITGETAKNDAHNYNFRLFVR